MEVLAPVFKIAGIVIGGEVIGKLMEESGHGGKVVFVKIVSYASCAYIALHEWWDLVHYVMRSFGV
ncbi:hypothetical protein KP806_07485 [Paenibacillus sp. N4]|uniref:hypothetical protein n=1 Tax=Paenibacillus vietnamensis TaxID=2590547 RepID=UPI001CD16204|nr:hypothetical protein [Paenibacillus vietnamensis]MCA0754888.1 hypothetical protein [Paenibacillus vietnamensis]